MSCTGFSARATKDLLQLFADKELFGKDARIVRAPHAEPTPVAGCSGLKLEGSAQPAGGQEWMVTAYVAADAHTMYMFALRNYTENYARTSGVFEQAVSTARIQPTQ
jgi:hypothetical protein